VFPEKITTEYQPLEPKFYTFMSTDSSGFNSFFHCLIFYDEVNEAELAYDFDLFNNVFKKQKTRRKEKKAKGQKGEEKLTMRVSEEEEETELFK
jgi:hypothetical protein